jgi:FdrA protein
VSVDRHPRAVAAHLTGGKDQLRKPDLQQLLDEPMQIVNLGLEEFARDLEVRGVAVVHVDWTPPAGVDPKLADLLSKLGS